jgi:hypothetical protein
VATSPKKDDEQEELERALEKEKRDDLQGDTEENRNLSGSTTWETLEEEARGEGREHRRKGDEASEEPPNPPRTTKGFMTAPKFGSAGSGGAELEPGPERD